MSFVSIWVGISLLLRYADHPRPGNRLRPEDLRILRMKRTRLLLLLATFAVASLFIRVRDERLGWG